MYEIRCCFWNSSGKGEFSHPSHRAKTTKASLPEICEAPLVRNFGLNYVNLELIIPEEGGAPVRYFHIESMDLDSNATLNYMLTRNECDIQASINNKKLKKQESKGRVMFSEERKGKEEEEKETLPYRIEGLKIGGSYVFRARAESEVGSGPFSVWSLEANLLSEETDVAKK
jgi:hypothetical protein